MAQAETIPARSTRGTKPVTQAFFTALETIPEASRAAVAKAAQAMIRDQIKTQREKTKVVAAKEMARAPAVKKMAKTPAPKSGHMQAVEPAKKMGRPSKPAKVLAAA